MTENQAIKVIKQEKQWESNARISAAFEMAEKALEEIQQYREIGTVEEIQSMKDNGSFSGGELAQLAIMQMKLKDYKAIGTIEEFKDLKEKSVAKKVDENECCPICYTYGKDDNGVAGEYCPNCGQKLGWEGGE